MIYSPDLVISNGKWQLDLQILWKVILKTLKWKIAYVWDMPWFTDAICTIYRPETRKTAEKLIKS